LHVFYLDISILYYFLVW